MTKQPPFASRFRLSRICRWLLALGVVKLCIFGALVAGYPLPEMSWDLLSGAQTAENARLDPPKAEATPTTPLAAMDSLLAQPPTADHAAQPENGQASSPQRNTGMDDPQGAAAARAASALASSSAGVRGAVSGLASVPPPEISASAQEHAPTLAASSAPASAAASAPSVPVATTAQNSPAAATAHPRMTTSAVADTTALQTARSTDDKSWWSQVQQLKALPFPRMGLDQVAHAATLDTPPSPAMPAPGGTDSRTSAFTPPAQIPSGLNPDGTPIPPRSSTAQPRPAGTSGPQFDPPANGAGNAIPSMLKPTTNVPVPKADSYVAPEDPNRKQQDLARREQEVLVLKQQMEQRLEELQAAERKVQGLLDEAKDVEAKKVSRLSAIYVNMKPKQAAKALESMDERTAVKILAGMSPKQSGEILTYADPMKTAKLTELISRMRTGQ